MKDKISIVIPVYNVEKYLRQCVDSVVGQDYRNMEIILVDDGSIDSSSQICDAYANSYKNIKVVHKVNEGLGLARNTGMDNATGRYIMFLDADDYIDSDCISYLYGLLSKHEADFVKSGLKKVDNNGKCINRSSYVDELFFNNAIEDELIPRLVGSKPEGHDSFDMSVCATLFDLSIIKKYNIRFNSEKELISEDLIFNIDYLKKSKVALVSSKVFYNYRYNNYSLTTKYRSDRFEKSVHFYEVLHNKLGGDGTKRETKLRLDKMFFIYLRMALAQEKRSLSKKKYAENIEKVDRIIGHKLTRKIIEEYPVKELGFRQKLFIFLIRHKWKYLILLLINANVLK